ncbi:MAG TPA: hypothetical protein VFT22_02545 [Kofleriaceae bacterium]|nr:hypothetical protein [Kofleriaceae bacterium]
MIAETETPDPTPTCYTAIRDEAIRTELASSLSKLGWRVVERQTGFHLVEALADVILEQAPRPAIGMVVVDERSPGCRGSSIARGLRELGIEVPVTVIAQRELAPAIAPDERIYVVEPEAAATTIPSIARDHLPLPPELRGAA